MTLVEDYLRAVALLLPRAQREDIAAELRDMILNRIETLEAERGRPLSQAETEDLLREVGHPLVIAARYRGGPQHLIGPALYPYWSFGVKVAVTLQFALAGVVFLLHALSGHESAHAFVDAIGSALTGSTILIGIATVLAWLIERQIVHVDYVNRWRVKDLRLLEFAAWDFDAWRERHMEPTPPNSPSAAEPNLSSPWASSSWAWSSPRGETAYPSRPARRSRRRSSVAARGLTSIAGGLVVILWWTGVMHFDLVGSSDDLRDLGLDVGALAGVNWASVEAVLYWAVLAYALGLILHGLAMLARPDAILARALVDVAIGAGVVGVSLWIWSFSPLSPYVQVGSLTGLALRVKALVSDGPPWSLATCLIILLAFNAFGGLIRVTRGLWRLLAPPAWSRFSLPEAEGASRRT